MSASNEWEEWHLTPTGWVPGSEQIDFVGVKQVAPPSDRVLTNGYHEKQSSTFSKLDRYTGKWNGAVQTRQRWTAS